MHYLIIPSNTIGGSEIRLVNNWTFTQQHTEYQKITLVVTQSLLNALSRRIEIWRELEVYFDRIVVTSFPAGFYGIQKKLRQLIENDLSDPEVVFVLLQLPLKAKKRKGTCLIHIHPGTSFVSHATFKGVIGQMLNVIKADWIDVLDPDVYKKLQRVFFYKRKAFRLTRFGISQHSIKLISKVHYETKRPELTFVGRFVELKQVLEFLNAVWTIDETLQTNGIAGYKFNVIGQGPLEEEVGIRIKELREKGIAIEHIVTDDPYQVLFRSKVFFSLQRHNNYPSQSLIESILCGCLPIITDCGNSRELIGMNEAYMVREKFSAEELANHCRAILSLSDENFILKSKTMIEYLKERFPAKRMADYYNDFLVSK